MRPDKIHRLLAAATAALFALATGPAAADPSITNRPDCGLVDEPAADFTLVDHNPTSPTYQQEITLSALEGKVVFLLFVRSTCGHCQSLATQLQSVADAQAASWGDDVVLLLVNMVGYEDDLPAFCGLSDLPVLQDTAAEQAADHTGASLYSNYVLQRDLRLHTTYYSLYLPADEQRLVTDIEAARAGAARAAAGSR